MPRKLIVVACADCGESFEYLSYRGRLPLRCDGCKSALQAKRRHRWYRANREHALAYARERHLSATPRTKTATCGECGEAFAYAVSRGVRRLFCDECLPATRRAITARFRETHREKLRAGGRAYQARRRAEDPEYAERGRQRSRALSTEKRHEINQRSYLKNAEKRRAESRAYRLAHPEKVKTWNRRWRRLNHDRALSHVALRRARIREAPAAEFIDRAVVFERDAGRCHICKRRCSSRSFHLDHLVPLSKGGAHTYENVAVAHPKCNLRRGAGHLPAQLRLAG